MRPWQFRGKIHLSFQALIIYNLIMGLFIVNIARDWASIWRGWKEITELSRDLLKGWVKLASTTAHLHELLSTMCVALPTHDNDCFCKWQPTSFDQKSFNFSSESQSQLVVSPYSFLTYSETFFSSSWETRTLI